MMPIIDEASRLDQDRQDSDLRYLINYFRKARRLILERNESLGLKWSCKFRQTSAKMEGV